MRYLLLDRFRLRGRNTAQGLLALLQAGRFTTGLKIDRETARNFGPDRAGNGEIPWTR